MHVHTLTASQVDCGSPTAEPTKVRSKALSHTLVWNIANGFDDEKLEI